MIQRVLKKTIHSKSGFTLIEVVIAVAILVTSLLPIFYFMSKGAQETDINVSKSYATNLASQILD